MKFGKMVGELHIKDGKEDLSVRYKKLKKQIKCLPALLPQAIDGQSGDDTTAPLSSNEAGAELQAAAATHPAGLAVSEEQLHVAQDLAAQTLSSNGPTDVADAAAMHHQEMPTAPQQSTANPSQPQHGTYIPSTPEEDEFINILSEDLGMLNDHFIDNEEDSVIRLHELSRALGAASTYEQLQPIQERLVKLHGEMVLLLHWSFLNFTAVTKILKKHDKHTGLHLKDQFLAHALQQPFASTEVLSSLVRRVETLIGQAINRLHSRYQSQEQGLGQQPGQDISAQQFLQQQRQRQQTEQEQQQHHAGGSSSSSSHALASSLLASGQNRVVDQDMIGRTLAALDTWETMSRNAVTPSSVLLPINDPARDIRRCTPQSPLQNPETTSPVRKL